MGKMIFRSAGLFTTIQDRGRHGWKQFGVPESGAMDQQSATLANLLVNNSPECALLEITLQGPEILFTAPAVIALTGADLSPRINQQSCPCNQAIPIRAHDVLTFGKPVRGVRAYLALKGGLQSTCVLNSYAQYPGITPTDRIRQGEEISYIPTDEHYVTHARVQQDAGLFTAATLDVYAGPEYGILEQQLTKQLTSSPFTIGLNNRMGFQLLNEDMPPHHFEMITSQVLPGCIQLTPSGKLMALMRDAQVTGGYPRVLQLSIRSINQLAQKQTGGIIRFKMIPLK